MLTNRIWDPDTLPDERLLFDRGVTESVELGRVTVQPGQTTNLGLHTDEEEIYVLLRGRALLRLGDETRECRPGDTVYVPRNTRHQMTCVSAEPLSYLYFANWPDK